MFSNIQQFRDKLARRQLCLGTGVTFSEPAVSEALATVVDFLWIDLEHNPIDLETLVGHLMAARTGSAAALVRVPGSEIAFLKRVLDAGAEGVIVPQVRSADEVRQVVSACRYPPLGTRGWGPRRGSQYGQLSQDDVVRAANQDLFVVAQIENLDAVTALDEIVSIPGLDSIAIGPYDLSASFGLLGQLQHSKVLEAIENIIRRGHLAGLSVGVGDEALAESSIRYAGMGADWIQCGSDFAYLLQTAKELMAEIRSGLANNI